MKKYFHLGKKYLSHRGMNEVAVIFMIFASIIAQCTFANEETFCGKSKVYMYGTACWPINFYASPRIVQKGTQNDIAIDFKIPYYMFYKSSHRNHGPHSIIILNLLISRNDEEIPTYYHSLLNIGASNNGGGEILSFIENFLDKSTYVIYLESSVFYIYRNASALTSFEYFVPKKIIGNGNYMQCINNCSMFGVYKNVSYNFDFPMNWAESYLDMKKMVESFLDSIIVKVEVK